MRKKILFVPFLGAILLCARPLRAADEKKDDPRWWKPKITIYAPPPVEVSTSPVFRTVDPQIIQKLIELLDETVFVAPERDPSVELVRSFRTPEGLELANRLTDLGVALSEALGWEGVKHIRVISEQNLKQRLTIVARWDHTPKVRSIALISLAKIRDRNDMVYFREALWSRNIGIRFAAIEALKIWGYPEAIPILQELTKKDESILIRVAAAKAIAGLKDAGGLEILRNYLQDKDWFVRALAAKSIGEVGTQQDYDLLISQLDREQTLNSNEFLKAEIAISALKLFPQKVEWEEQEKKRKKEERERKRKKLPPVAPAPTVAKAESKKGILFELDPLVVTAPRLVIQEDLVAPQINFQLLKMIQEKEDLRISEEMINQSATYKDLNSLITPNGIRLKARYTVLGFLLAEGLSGTRQFQLQDQLIRIARERKNPDVSSYALIALAFGRDRNSLGLFQEALRSDVAADRFAAVEALKIWGYPEAISILLGVTKLDKEEILRVYAARAALLLGEPLGKDILIRALDNPDWVMRAMAMRYFAELGGAEDYPKLLAYLGSQQPKIVQAELCSALLRLYQKKFAADNRGEDK